MYTIRKNVKIASKFGLQNGTKNNNMFFSHVSRSMLCLHFDAVAFQSEEVLKKGTLRDLFWNNPGSAPRRTLSKNTSSLPNFIQINQAVLGNIS